jgi:hypothetical protein
MSASVPTRAAPSPPYLPVPMPYATSSSNDRNLTLRTVTTLIRLLQRFCNGTPITQDVVTCPQSSTVKITQTKHLRTLNAIATLLVRDREVVAVTIACQEPLSFVACSSQSSASDGTMANDSDNENIFHHNHQFFAALNPRDTQFNTSPLLAKLPAHEPISPVNPFNYLCNVW